MKGALAPLAWIGRQGTRALAASIAIGAALPAAAAVARPLIAPCVIGFLALTFARADLSGLRALARRPARLGVLTLWSTLALPAAIALVVAAIGRSALGDDLTLGLAITAAAPPVISVPAVALLLGIEATAAVAVLVVSLALTPLTAPVLAAAIAGAAVPLDPLQLALRLGLLLAAATLLAVAARRLGSAEAIARHGAALDGLSVLLLFAFALGALDGVADQARSDPMLLVRYAAIAFAIAIGGVGAALLALWRLGPQQALVFGLATGHRSTGVLVAVIATTMPRGAWLFFAVGQLPIYLLPLFLEPLARVLRRRELRSAPR